MSPWRQFLVPALMTLSALATLAANDLALPVVLFICASVTLIWCGAVSARLDEKERSK